MKKSRHLQMISYMIFSLLIMTSCQQSTHSNTASKKISISFWTYPIGDFSNKSTVSSFISSFEKKYPSIQVNVDYLDYASGDEQVSAALEASTAPDVIMEGPERLVSSWGAKGKMVELKDLWTKTVTADINRLNPIIAKACQNAQGQYYEYPLCMTPHCMAINYEIFKKAGALKYLNLKTRTWTTEGFIKACQKIRNAHLVKDVAKVYCGGQGGDQGTRALVTNLYGASFTNKAHTAYTINSKKGLKALQLLVNMCKTGSLSYDTQMQGTEELSAFANEKVAMSFAWNSSNQKLVAGNIHFTPYVMNFPASQKEPSLCGGIWGFGIFNNHSQTKREAAKTFIRYMCNDASQVKKSVQATGSFSVRSSLQTIYKDTNEEKRMSQYYQLLKNIGDYYNVTSGFSAQRTVWWNMLQQIFNGTPVKKAANQYVDTSDKTIRNQ